MMRASAGASGRQYPLAGEIARQQLSSEVPMSQPNLATLVLSKKPDESQQAFDSTVAIMTPDRRGQLATLFAKKP